MTAGNALALLAAAAALYFFFAFIKAKLFKKDQWPFRAKALDLGGSGTINIGQPRDGSGRFTNKS